MTSTETVAVAPLVLDAFAMLRAAHDGVQLEADPSLWQVGSVLGQEGDLHQVLMNLGANAIQASGPRAEVRFEAANRRLSRPHTVSTGELQAGEYVVLSVEDRGCGMDERTRARIFEPLFSTRPRGHGLGLATVSAILQSHGGGIDVSSVRGEGSRFDVWLPQAPGGRATRPRRERYHHGRRGSRQRGMTPPVRTMGPSVRRLPGSPWASPSASRGRVRGPRA